MVSNADGVEGDEGGVDEDGDDGVEDGADEHDAFDEQEEEGDNGDYDVELCDARRMSVMVNEMIKWQDERHGWYIQLTPWQRHFDGLIVCVGVDDGVGITVPAMVRAFLP